jgi:ribose 5-phosphate isomerase B
MTKVAIGADHAGFGLIDELEVYLVGRGYSVQNFGPKGPGPVDYPIPGCEIAKYIQEHTGSLGIAICNSGKGMGIILNRFSRVYGVPCDTIDSASKARRTGANVLCLSAEDKKFLDVQPFVNAFLTTEVSDEPRHKRRLELIDRLARSG